MHLPKMVSLKWEYRGVWVLGVCRQYYGNIKGEKEGTSTWDNTYQMKLHGPPTFIVGGGFAQSRGMVQMCYLSWSADVS